MRAQVSLVSRARLSKYQRLPKVDFGRGKTRGTASHAATHLVRRAQEEEEVSRQRATSHVGRATKPLRSKTSEALTRAPQASRRSNF